MRVENMESNRNGGFNLLREGRKMKWDWFFNCDNKKQAENIAKNMNISARKCDCTFMNNHLYRYRPGKPEIFENMTDEEKSTMAGLYRKQLQSEKMKTAEKRAQKIERDYRWTHKI